MDAVARRQGQADPASLNSPHHSTGHWLPQIGILLIVAILTRVHLFGNPVAHLDDQFYLLVGRSIFDGQLPYIDIWDRKPFGLFLLYAAIAALGGSGVIETQIVAGLFAVLTAFTISRIGDRIAPFPGGLLAGASYLILMPMLSGASGQSPVFYNLLMAWAGLLAFDAWREKHDRKCWYRGTMAMLAIGLALTLKPTALFEGCFFGLLFVWLRWQQTLSPRLTIFFSAVLIIIAIIPTGLIFSYYAAIGAFADIWQATVISVLNKESLSPKLAMILAGFMAMKLLIPVACTATSLRRLVKTDQQAVVFFIAWLAAALLGVVSVPNFFDHYALPFLVPLTASMAVALAQPRWGLAWLSLMAATGAAFSNEMLKIDGRERAAQFASVANLVSAHLRGGCLYVFEGPVHLYTATNACRLSRFVFPDHLNSAIEAKALTIDPTTEISRIFAGRPAVVVDAERIFLDENEDSRRLVEQQLACNYRLAGVASKFGARFNQPLSIWVRRPGWRNCAVN